MKKLIADKNMQHEFLIESAATSTEELGNDTYPPARAKLKQEGIPFARHFARQITAADYNKYDLLIGMDKENIFYMNRCWTDTEEKIHKLLEYTGSSAEVADPWYSGNFDKAFDDIFRGCQALLDFLLNGAL